MKKFEAISNEVDAIRDRYARRKALPEKKFYDMLNPSVYMSQQEKERALIRWITSCGLYPLENKRLLEIGCGFGTNLLLLIRLGFSPENLVANELLSERAEKARKILPQSVDVIVGDALEIDFGRNTFDVVFQSTVFTSILDNHFQQRLASHLWDIVKPSGGVLWYDFIYNNPRNPDVRGIPVHRICELFPQGNIKYWRVTLAPLISRIVTRVHPRLYDLFNLFLFLRTHVLCWIAKSKGDDSI